MRLIRFLPVMIAASLALSKSSSADPIVKTVEIESKSVGRKLLYIVALPSDYEKTDKRYPVLYLLHGYSGNFTSWARHGAAALADEQGLIVVMPDGGNSWWINWAESEDGQKNAWEDFVTKDLLSHVDSTYRTIALREARAINGLSMGGFGALTVGIRHPELYCTAGSHSGALAFAKSIGEGIAAGKPPVRSRTLSDKPDPRVPTPGFSSQVERTPKGKIFVTKDQCDEFDPFAIIAKTPREKLPHIYVDCGTEDVLFKANLDLLKLLAEKNVTFSYGQSPGEHNGAYWRREMHHSAAVQAEIIRRSLAARTASEPAAKPAQTGGSR